jgi:hypothetical protein
MMNAPYIHLEPNQTKKVAMELNVDSLDRFKKICHKICLNVPDACRWHWDQKRNMAVIVLEEEDAEMVFYPLFKEFCSHWNFSSINKATVEINDYIHTEYGLMPGQVFFTSHPVNNTVLGVAWWPWGDEEKVSMRVGLIPVGIDLPQDFSFQCLSQWLDIECDPAQTPKDSRSPQAGSSTNVAEGLQ